MILETVINTEVIELVEQKEGRIWRVLLNQEDIGTIVRTKSVEGVEQFVALGCFSGMTSKGNLSYETVEEAARALIRARFIVQVNMEQWRV